MSRIIAPRSVLLFALILGLSSFSYLDCKSGTWEIGILDSNGNVGQFCELQTDVLGNMHVVYLQLDQRKLITMSRIAGIWESAEIVDGSGNVSGYCAICIDSNGVRRISYKRSNVDALWYAGPEARDEWEISNITNSSSDIGQYLSVNQYDSGALSLSCLDATAGSLLLMERDNLGAWSVPTVVDPGPKRGTHSDHAYRPGIGYSFSERDSDRNLLLCADPVLHPAIWAIGKAYETVADAGRFVSSAIMPDGRLASVFYRYDNTGRGQICELAMDENFKGAARVVADSIGASAGDGVYCDLAISLDGSWHISYRNPLQGGLWYASADSNHVTGVDVEKPYVKSARALALHQNVPNPFNPQTRITFSLPSTAHVTLCLYDVKGSLIRTLVNERRLAGEHTLTWNGNDSRGVRVASGVYLMRLIALGEVQTKKVVLIR